MQFVCLKHTAAHYFRKPNCVSSLYRSSEDHEFIKSKAHSRSLHPPRNSPSLGLRLSAGERLPLTQAQTTEAVLHFLLFPIPQRLRQRILRIAATVMSYLVSSVCPFSPHSSPEQNGPFRKQKSYYVTLLKLCQSLPFPQRDRRSPSMAPKSCVIRPPTLTLPPTGRPVSLHAGRTHLLAAPPTHLAWPGSERCTRVPS